MFYHKSYPCAQGGCKKRVSELEIWLNSCVPAHPADTNAAPKPGVPRQAVFFYTYLRFFAEIQNFFIQNWPKTIYRRDNRYGFARYRPIFRR
ncbi:hypothetical protein Hanom_Chr14g01280321 [Helianthus anomalus]